MKRNMTFLATLAFFLPACADDGRDGTTEGDTFASTSVGESGTDSGDDDDSDSDSDSGTPAGGYDVGDGMEAWCGFERVADDLPASVMLVLDNSGSMKDTLEGSTDTRWESLVATVNDLLAADDYSRFGLTVFPSEATVDVCSVPSEPQVAAGPDTHDAIYAQLDHYSIEGPNGYTPVADAYRAAADDLSGLDHGGNRAVVLITDGMANCAPDHAGDAGVYDERLVGFVSDAFAAGTPTYVVGIAPGESAKDTASGQTISNLDALNDAAAAGGMARPGAEQFYRADTAADLQSAIDTISARVGCSIEIDERPWAPGRTILAVGDQEYALVDSCEAGDGWALHGTTVELCGGACDAYREGHKAEGRYLCNIEG